MSKAIEDMTFEEIITGAIKADFENFFDMYDHETYGQDGQEYITERSAEKCVEEYKEQFDAEDFIRDYLKENYDFCTKLELLVKSTNL